MGIPVLILGHSGSGKSTSLRNFGSEEIGIFNVASKPLPFRNKFKYMVNGNSYGSIEASLKKNTLKTYVIDDAQYLMAFELLSKANELGYKKYTEAALNFYQLVQTIIQNTSPDTIVYMLMHTEMGDDGKIKAKTSGKMLDNQLTLEGLFSIVLMTEADKDGHRFLTQGDGLSTAKSPMDMFEHKIDNDLKFVDTTIRDYYFGGK